jgi:hypothetical protein
MRTVTFWAWNLAVFAVLFAWFRYLADFASGQSFFLAMTAWAGYAMFRYLEGFHPIHFFPYSVSVYVKWYKLLHDYGLIKDEDEFRELGGEGALPDGLHFTVLRPEGPPPAPGLIYWENKKRFVTEPEFTETMHRDSRWKEHWRQKVASGLLPRLDFMRRRDGYEIGLHVPGDWWKLVCATGDIGELANTKTEADVLTGTTRLVVATLPYSAFHIYHHKGEVAKRRQEQERIYFLQGGPTEKDSKDKRLAKYGWERIDWSNAEHKYFTVTHWCI